jgi:membrane peptidoglycan carboxypeptidase
MIASLTIQFSRLLSCLTAMIRRVLLLVGTTIRFVSFSLLKIAGTGLLAVNRSLLFVPRLIRAALLTGKAGLIGLPVVVVALVVVAALSNPYFRTDLEYAHERSSAVELTDARGSWIGIIPPASFRDWSDGSVLSQDHAAVPVGKVPDSWRTCIVFLEDREFDGLSRAFGIDPLAVLKSGWHTMSGNRRRGASTLYMQVVRTLYGRTPGDHEATGELVFRKLSELLGASTLVRMMNDSDPGAAARFVGMHLPLVIGASGSSFGEPLHGIELASRILFGTPASELPLEKQAILAAAVKAPILLAPPGDAKAAAAAAARWKRTKERADYCLRHAFAATETEQALERLAALDLPKPVMDSALARLLPADPKEAWRIAVNPVRRSLYFVRHELGYLRKQLERVAGPDWRGRVTSVQLTTAADASREFFTSISSTLPRLQSTMGGLSWNLAPGSDAASADVVMACADHRGDIQRIFESRQGLFWNRKSPVGSIAKEVAAVALGSRSQPETQYCRAPIHRVASASQGNVDHCANSDSRISAREAFARSDSEAVHWALRHLANRPSLEKTAAVFALPAFADTPPETALALGTFEMTPAEMLRQQRAIGAGLAGESQDISAVGIVSRYSYLDADGKTQVRAVRQPAEISGVALNRLFTPNVKSFVSSALRATSGSNGTLAALSALKDRLGGHLYAKTGTVSVQGSTRDLHIAGTFLRNGKPWSFVVSVGTPVSSKPLGRNLTGGQLSPLAALAVCGPNPERVATSN